MSWRMPTPIKFSNLLQTNPQSCLYGLDLSASVKLQSTHSYFEKLKRKSVNLGSLKSKKELDFEIFPNHQQNKDEERFVHKSKINRLLINADFNKESKFLNITPNKKKRIYVIKKKDGPIKVQNKSKKNVDVLHRGSSPQSKLVTQNQVKQNQQIKVQDMFKVKKRPPRFGIQQIAPRIAAKKHSPNCQRAIGLCMSTSSSNFYNSSFYMSSKLKDSQIHTQQTKLMLSELTPEIKNIVPNKVNLTFLQKKKQIEKMYTTNSFCFPRSKTEQIQKNVVCGWQQFQIDENQSLSFDVDVDD